MYSKKLTILAFAAVLLAACSTTSRHYGNYYNKNHYWGPMFTLHPDSTFSYATRANIGDMVIQQEMAEGTATIKSENYIFEDSSYGRYSLAGDTLILKYNTEQQMGPYKGFNIRPARLFWTGKKLYYFLGDTGLPLKEKEQYMQWSKYKVPNRYRLDEKHRIP